MPGGGHSSKHERGKRTEIHGWSPSSVRRLRNFLYSVQVEGLSGHGYAITLTMRDMPPNSDALGTVLKSLMKRYDRMGLLRLHWVIEWQHPPGPGVSHWLELTEPWGSLPGSQDFKPIESAAGWLQYLAKHGARSVKHYQRQGMPPGWEKTGRLWGHRGDWPRVEEPMRFDIDRAGWFRLRRMVRAWRLADARQERDARTRARRVASARRMLSHHDPKTSQVRGTSEWVPEDVYLGFLGLLADQGHAVQQVA